MVDDEAPPGAHVLAVHPVVRLQHQRAAVPHHLCVGRCVHLGVCSGANIIRANSNIFPSHLADEDGLVTHTGEHSLFLSHHLGLVCNRWYSMQMNRYVLM